MSSPVKGKPPAAERFALLHGASWLTPDGEVHAVPGFHEEWLRRHEDIAEGARNVCELVLNKRWISVSLFDGGYLELMVPDRSSADIKAALLELLSRNSSSWKKALVMSMDEEGYVMLERSDAADAAALDAALAKTL